MSKLITLLLKNNYNLTKEDIENNKSDLGIKDNNYGNTVLMYYLWLNENPNFEIIKLLEKEKDILNDNNDTPLKYYLTYNKNPSIEIIEYFSNQIGVTYNYNNNTVLKNYLQNNKNPKLEIIKLLEKEKDINDKDNTTPLMHYCMNRNIEYLNLDIIEYFSDQIEKINNCYKNALIYYLEFNNYPTIDMIKLLEKEKDISDFNYFPLIHYFMNFCIKNINTDIIKYFENQIGLKNNNKETALMYYLEYNKNPSINIIKLLEIEKEIFNYKNETPLMYYCMNRHIENLNPDIIEYFSNQIVKINKYEETALIFYLEFNKNPNLEIIKLLNFEKNIFDKNAKPLILYFYENYYSKKYINNKEIIEYFYFNFGYTDFKNYDDLYLDIY